MHERYDFEPDQLTRLKDYDIHHIHQRECGWPRVQIVRIVHMAAALHGYGL